MIHMNYNDILKIIQLSNQYQTTIYCYSPTQKTQYTVPSW